MGRIRAALLPPTNGGLGCPPVLPYPAARQARKAAEIIGLLAVAWLLVELPLLWAAAAVMAGGASLLVLRFPWLVWPGLAIALPFASGIKIGPLSMADGMLAVAIFLWFVDGVRKNRLRLNMGFLPGLFLLYLLALLLSFPNAINLQKAVEGVIKWTQMLVANSADPGGADAASGALADLGSSGGWRTAGRDRDLPVRFPHRAAQFSAAGPLYARGGNFRPAESIRPVIWD